MGAGLLPIVDTPAHVVIDSTYWEPGSTTNARIDVHYLYSLSPNSLRPGYPDDISLVFHDDVVDTSVALAFIPARPAKFELIDHAPDGDRRLDFVFVDADGDHTLNLANERIDVVTYVDSDPGVVKTTWRFQLATDALPTEPLGTGDAYALAVSRPFGAQDVLVFATHAEYVDPNAPGAHLDPYVVPNPYVASASFEPERFAVSGRGERRIEFRGLPGSCTIRIYNIRGELVQTLKHEGSSEGYEPWDLRTKDSLDVAPGLYIFHVDGGPLGKSIGKFAIIK